MMVCLRHLVNTLTNTNDILSVAFADLVSKSQLCQVLRSQGYPLSPPLFQNRSRLDYRQVQLSRVPARTSSHLANIWLIPIACWCQPFVIKPDDIPKVLLHHLASKP